MTTQNISKVGQIINQTRQFLLKGKNLKETVLVGIKIYLLHCE